MDAYGAYEIINEPSFSRNRLSLLDRGVVCAIAHVRGGGDMGRKWYEDGKFLKKKNTFHDVIACAEHLIKEGWTSPSKMCLEGGSAGGMTVGAVANMRPDLFLVLLLSCIAFQDCIELNYSGITPSYFGNVVQGKMLCNTASQFSYLVVHELVSCCAGNRCRRPICRLSHDNGVQILS